MQARAKFTKTPRVGAFGSCSREWGHNGKTGACLEEDTLLSSLIIDHAHHLCYDDAIDIKPTAAPDISVATMLKHPHMRRTCVLDKGQITTWLVL